MSMNTVPADLQYGYVRPLNIAFDEALARTEAALKGEGFGVLCRIDIREKLKEKLGVAFPPYVILGACNPPLAYGALQRDIHLGLLLPCNVVVYEQDGVVYVAAIDAVRMLSITGRPELGPTAQLVNASLRKVIDNVVAIS